MGALGYSVLSSWVSSLVMVLRFCPCDSLVVMIVLSRLRVITWM